MLNNSGPKEVSNDTFVAAAEYKPELNKWFVTVRRPARSKHWVRDASDPSRFYNRNFPKLKLSVLWEGTQKECSDAVNGLTYFYAAKGIERGYLNDESFA